VDENLLHALPHIEGLQNVLLLLLLDIEDARDEIGDLTGIVDVDHIEAHLFREEWVVLAELLHLADERTRERLHLVGVEILVVEVGHCSNDRRLFGDILFNPKTLECRNENIDSTIRKIDLLYNFGCSPYHEQVVGRSLVRVLFLQHETNHSVSGYDLLDELNIRFLADHDRRENAGENRFSDEGDDRKFVG